jgi:acyl-CoA thioesterase
VASAGRGLALGRFFDPRTGRLVVTASQEGFLRLKTKLEAAA